jgi:hypothetical protein
MPSMLERRQKRQLGLVDSRLLKALAPGNISGLKVWFDFTDVTTLYQSHLPTAQVSADAQAIGLALDKSSNANHAYQVTSGYRPLWKANQVNSLGGALFDGSDDLLSWMTAISAGPATVAMVWRNDETSTSYRAFSGDLFVGGQSYDYYFGRSGDAGVVFVSAESAATARAHILYVTNVTANRKMYLNGSSITASANTSTTAFANLTGISDAAGQPKLKGLICELCIWDNLLSDTDRGLWNAYVSSKYALGF